MIYNKHTNAHFPAINCMFKIFSQNRNRIFSCNFYDENAVLMYVCKLSLKPINTSLKKGHIQT